MKRPTLYLRERQMRLSAYAENAQVKRRRKQWKPPEQRFVRPGEVIFAPEKFNLTRGDGIDVAKFLRAAAARVLHQKKPVRLNLKRVKSFYVPGAILLFAEIDRLVSQSPLPKPISLVDPHLRQPREVLKQIEIHKITGDRCDTIPKRDDVIYWRATKGTNQSGENLKLLEVVAERANREHADQLQVGGVWRGVSEAVANTVDHAYSVPREDGFQGLPTTKWWMFTQIRDGRFTAAVCDLGCGYRATINRTIPESFIAKMKATFIGENPDVQAIKTAMEYGRSGTRLDHRGKGSRDALSVLARHGNGELFILSNSGWVQYRYANGVQTSIDSAAIGIDIMGTIIWWNLPLSGDGHVRS